MRELILIIDEKNTNKTVGQLLKSHFKLSSRLISKLKNSDGIHLNGNHITVRGIVKIGDELKITMPEQNSPNVIPVNLPLDIIYEDSDILVVNKPSDMPVHPSMNNFDNTLGNAVRYYYKNIPFVFRPVNRLDKDTTGLVVVAKTPQAGHSLSVQIQNKTFKKTYLCVTNGVPSPVSGTIDLPIRRETESIIKRCVASDGQNAVTHYEVLKVKNNKALIKVNIDTGRTHQIRVHFSYIGCPLENDFLYGKQNGSETFKLHCCKLTFRHPVTNEDLLFECSPPFEF